MSDISHFESDFLHVFNAYKVFDKMPKEIFLLLVKVHLNALICVPQSFFVIFSYLFMVYIQVDDKKGTDEQSDLTNELMNYIN